MGTKVNIIVGSHVWAEDPGVCWVDWEVVKVDACYNGERRRAAARGEPTRGRDGERRSSPSTSTCARGTTATGSGSTALRRRRRLHGLVWQTSPSSPAREGRGGAARRRRRHPLTHHPSPQTRRRQMMIACMWNRAVILCFEAIAHQRSCEEPSQLNTDLQAMSQQHITQQFAICWGRTQKLQPFGLNEANDECATGSSRMDPPWKANACPAAGREEKMHRSTRPRSAP